MPRLFSRAAWLHSTSEHIRSSLEPSVPCCRLPAAQRSLVSAMCCSPSGFWWASFPREKRKKIFPEIHYSLCTAASLWATTDSHCLFPLEPLLDFLYTWLHLAWVAHLIVRPKLSSLRSISPWPCCILAIAAARFCCHSGAGEHQRTALCHLGAKPACQCCLHRQLSDAAVHDGTSEPCCTSFATKWVLWSDQMFCGIPYQCITL